MLKVKPKVLFIRSGALGDVLMITPIIRRFYMDRMGDCEIYIKTLYPNIFIGNPYVTKCFVLGDINETTFDIIYNLDWVYERNNDRHVLDAYEEYVFGNRSTNRHCELNENDSDIHYVESLLIGIDNFIVIHMRCINNSDPDQAAKNIDEGIWKKIIVDILNNSDVTILQIGGPTDLCFGGSENLLDMRQKLTNHQVKYLCEKSKCYIGTDSGPAHIAATSSVAMVVLYTIAKIEYFLPTRKNGKIIPIKADIECQGCLINVMPGGKLNCQRDVQCRKSFSPEIISEQVLELIS
jgi:ADP-heptose:LPS heptosyltransferase